MSLRLTAVLLLAACAGALRAGEPAPGFTITEAELQRVPVPRSGIFPWKLPSPGGPKKPEKEKPKTDPGAAASPLDVTGGDGVIQALGPFSRIEKEVKGEDGKPARKEVLTLRDSVEIEQPSTGVVLRGDSIGVERDIASGDVEMLRATGKVEIVLPGQWAKGETLEYESRFDDKGRLTKQTITVSGDVEKGKPATLGSGENALQAFKFVMDLRLDTYRALGGALAEVRMPEPEKSAEPATPGTGSLVPSFSVAGGGIITISCDGEMLFESYSGKLTLRRNVQVEQASLKIWTDELILKVQSTEPNVEAAPGPSGLFTGSLESIECKGRVELIGAGNVLHCDRLLYDMGRSLARLEMTDPAQHVKVYMRDPATGAALTAVKIKHFLEVDTTTSTTKSGGPQSTEAVTGEIPELRPHRAPRIRMLKERNSGAAE
ncbi:MAG: hypothetical protein HS116_15305 [Planctomycetes bacterium]|nr:hypothetical protein [Planctomycetota bacterium]